jgi:hypothetical protein
MLTNNDNSESLLKSDPVSANKIELDDKVEPV